MHNICINIDNKNIKHFTHLIEVLVRAPSLFSFHKELVIEMDRAVGPNTLLEGALRW
jgi:hypothetical protein